MNAVETQKELKTCKITLVSPGLSDRVIKVYPAEHEAEKIWLTNRPGIDRWAEVKRTMDQCAPRGERVPEPVAYHKDGKNLIQVDITEADIPVVKLEGAVLSKPKHEKFERPVPPNLEKQNTNLRFEKLEAQVGQLSAGLNTILEHLKAQGDKPPVAKPEVRVPCSGCDKDFANEQAMKMHAGRFHKEAK